MKSMTKQKVNIIGISGKIKSGKDTAGEVIRMISARRSLRDTQKFNFSKWISLPENLRKGPYIWELKKFAGLLKKWAAEALQVPVEMMEKDEFKRSYLSEEWSYIIEQRFQGSPTPQPVKYHLQPRTILQKLGTEVGRSIHANFWVNALFAQYIPIRTYKCRLDEQQCTEECHRNHELMEKCSCCVTTETPRKWIITDVRFQNEAGTILSKGGILIRINRTDANRLGRPDKSPHISETALDNYPAFTHTIDNNGTMEELIEKLDEILSQYEI